jgi:hypothetical protein
MLRPPVRCVGEVTPPCTKIDEGVVWLEALDRMMQGHGGNSRSITVSYTTTVYSIVHECYPGP